MLFKMSVLKNFAKFIAWTLGMQLYLKKTKTQLCSCEICEIFKNTFFYITPLVAASGKK